MSNRTKSNRSKYRWLTLSAMALGLSLSVAGATEFNPAAAIYKLPDQLQWKAPLGVSGAKQAVVSAIPRNPACTWCSPSGFPTT